MEKKDEELKEETKTVKNNNSKIVIIALAALLVIAVIVIVILVVKPKENSNEGSNNTTSTTTTVVAEDMITITFDANGGEPVEPMTVKKGEKITLPSTTREGYVFNGWLDDNDDMPNTVTSFNEDKHFTANWFTVEEMTKTMTIKFDSKGGSKVNPMTLKCNYGLTAEVKELPKNPTKEGYTFRAWEDSNGKAILPGATLTCNDVTLYAAYDKEGEQNKAKCPDGYTSDGNNCIKNVYTN